MAGSSTLRHIAPVLTTPVAVSHQERNEANPRQRQRPGGGKGVAFQGEYRRKRER